MTKQLLLDRVEAMRLKDVRKRKPLSEVFAANAQALKDMEAMTKGIKPLDDMAKVLAYLRHIDANDVDIQEVLHACTVDPAILRGFVGEWDEMQLKEEKLT